MRKTLFGHHRNSIFAMDLAALPDRFVIEADGMEQEVTADTLPQEAGGFRLETKGGSLGICVEDCPRSLVLHLPEAQPLLCCFRMPGEPVIPVMLSTDALRICISGDVLAVEYEAQQAALPPIFRQPEPELLPEEPEEPEPLPEEALPEEPAPLPEEPVQEEPPAPPVLTYEEQLIRELKAVILDLKEEKLQEAGSTICKLDDEIRRCMAELMNARTCVADKAALLEERRTELAQLAEEEDRLLSDISKAEMLLTEKQEALSGVEKQLQEKINALGLDRLSLEAFRKQDARAREVLSRVDALEQEVYSVLAACAAGRLGTETSEEAVICAAAQPLD